MRKSKYTTDSERIIARRLSNNKAQRKHRANEKLVRKPINTLPNINFNFTNKYSKDLFKGCIEYVFTHSLTFTNSKLVTLNMHNKSVEDLLDKLVNEGYIKNYVKTNEDNGNFHAHMVVQLFVSQNELKKYLDANWGNGFYKVKTIKSELHYRNAVWYCLKQLDVTSTNNTKQSLIDTWSCSLLEKRIIPMKSEFNLAAFKSENGLNMRIDYSKYRLKTFLSYTTSHNGTNTKKK